MAGEHTCYVRMPPACLAVKMGNVGGPLSRRQSLRTVEAKREAKWPPQGQSTEQRRRPGQLPREVLHERSPDDLSNTGTRKPEGELAILTGGDGGHLSGVDSRRRQVDGEG